MTNWDLLSFGSMLKVKHGRSQKEVETNNGRYPILGSGGVIGRSDTPIYSKPSVLIGRNGTIDRPRFMETPFWTVDTLFFTEIFDGFDPKFIYYKFCTIDWYKYNEASGVPSLNASVIERIETLMPQLAEQQRIASVLTDVDVEVNSLDTLIAKKKDIKQGAMQQLLTGKTRLPGFSGEWKEVRLGDFATMSSGGTPSSKVKEYYGGNIKWASIADMTKSGKRLIKTEEHLTDLGLVNSSAAIYKTPIILYAMYASLGEVCICHEEVSSSQAILGIVPGNNLEIEFLYYLLLAYKPIVKTLGQQGTQSNLNKKMVQDFIFSLPPDQKEQIAIAEVLSDMDAEIDALVARREKTALIKTGMMQELLTGRTRLL